MGHEAPAMQTGRADRRTNGQTKQTDKQTLVALQLLLETK